MLLYRVHPWVSSATDGEPGHPLYIHPQQGWGRVDNPDHYLTFYVADSPAGAIAEVWGNHATWTDDLLSGPPKLPGSVRAITTFEADVAIIDLDDVGTLTTYGIKPSRVVTRHRVHTQAWALAVFKVSDRPGVRWWSYHDPDWGSIGLWDISDIEVASTELLTRDHPAVIQAGAVLSRSWAAA